VYCGRENETFRETQDNDTPQYYRESIMAENNWAGIQQHMRGH